MNLTLFVCKKVQLSTINLPCNRQLTEPGDRYNWFIVKKLRWPDAAQKNSAFLQLLLINSFCVFCDVG